MASVLATYFDSMYELRMIAAEAESILPRSIPLALEGDLPAARNSVRASKVVIRSSHKITGNSVTVRNLEQNALTLRAAFPTEPSIESGKPTTMDRAWWFAAKDAMLIGSSAPVAFIDSIGVARVPVGSLRASPILTSP